MGGTVTASIELNSDPKLTKDYIQCRDKLEDELWCWMKDRKAESFLAIDGIHSDSDEDDSDDSDDSDDEEKEASEGPKEKGDTMTKEKWISLFSPVWEELTTKRTRQGLTIPVKIKIELKGTSIEMGHLTRKIQGEVQTHTSYHDLIWRFYIFLPLQISTLWTAPLRTERPVNPATSKLE